MTQKIMDLHAKMQAAEMLGDTAAVEIYRTMLATALAGK